MEEDTSPPFFAHILNLYKWFSGTFPLSQIRGRNISSYPPWGWEWHLVHIVLPLIKITSSLLLIQSVGTQMVEGPVLEHAGKTCGEKAVPNY